MKVVVTGNEGYIGSILAPLLADRGHEVVGVDTGFYRSGVLYPPTLDGRTVRIDIRDVESSLFEGVDAVVHLAELSNDPLGQLAPHVTYEINHRGSLHVASVAKEAGVERFVYASSCSVYGIAAGELVDEESPLRPQTTYAECKMLVERDVSALADEGFSPTFLRNGTAYGASPRIRLDIVLNNLAAHAATSGVIRMDSDGTPWRPLVHVEDISRAIAATLEAPRERVHRQTLNVGAGGANYRVREIAEEVARAFEGCELSFGDRGADTRSYRVSFDKIRSVLPEFEPRWDIAAGARQLRDLFTRVQLTRERFEGPEFIRLRQIEHLLQRGLVDGSLHWRVVSGSAARPA